MRTSAPPLDDLLFGQTRGRILSALYGGPDDARFVRQLARETGVSVGTVQRELTTLTDAGLIVRSRDGGQVYYRANRESPVYEELRSLLAKTTGVFRQLRVALEPLAERIEFAFVYGSFARGEETAASDVDLMVIGSVSLDEVLEHLGPVERRLQRPIHPSVYSLKELKMKLKANHHFLKALQKGKNVFLLGSEDEFRAIR